MSGLLLGAGQGAGSRVRTYVSETFSGSTVALTTHTPDIDVVGNGWVQVGSSGDWRTDSSGQCSDEAAAGSEHWITIDSGAADCAVRATISSGVGAGQDNGLIVRASASSNSSANANMVTAETVTNDSKIWRIAGGVFTNLSSAAATWANGDRLVVILEGSTIIVYQNGTELHRAVSTQSTEAGQHGLRRHAGGSYVFDDFVIDNQVAVTT